MRKTGIKKLLGFLVITLLVLLVFGYYRLGGLNSVQVETISVENYHLLGRYFEGTYQSDTLSSYFNEMKVFIDDETIKGQPVIIYDMEPTGSRGHSKSFIGIRTEKEQPSFKDLKKREISASKSIRVSKNGHISVMPNPKKIKRLIRSYAQDHQLEIDTFCIEIYHPDNRLVIEQPVIDSSCR